MRKILFRGMSLEGKWHYGNLAILTQDLDQIVKAGTYISNRVGVPFAYKVRPETVGQFIGMDDATGEDIFEGDVLASILYSFNPNTNKHDIPYREANEGYVKYGDIKVDTGITGFGEGNGNFSSMGFYCKTRDFMNPIYPGMKIIGNIYENPELING